MAPDWIEQALHRTRDVKRFLEPYAAQEDLYLRPIKLAKPNQSPDVDAALEQIKLAIAALHDAYLIEADLGDMPKANSKIKEARDAMHTLDELASDLARKNIGVPMFDAF